MSAKRLLKQLPKALKNGTFIAIWRNRLNEPKITFLWNPKNIRKGCLYIFLVFLLCLSFTEQVFSAKTAIVLLLQLLECQGYPLAFVKVIQIEIFLSKQISILY